VNIIIEKKNIFNVTKNAIKIRSARSTVEAFKCFKIEASKKRQELKLTASNGEIFLSERVSATVEEEGACLVPATFFNEAISKSNDVIKITQNAKQMNIKSGNMDLNVITLDVNDFPKPTMVKENSIKIDLDKNIFQKSIDKTLFAVSSDETRGNIVGILFEIEQGHITSVGVDGFRMAVFDSSIDATETKKLIIHGKLIGIINKILSNAKDEKIMMVIDDNTVRFDFDKVRIIAKVMDGEFVDYNSIFPTNHNTSVVIDKNEILMAVDRSTIINFDDNVNHHNLVRLDVEKDHVTISSSSQNGNISEEIPANITGGELNIGFNARYLLDALKRIEEDKICLEFQTSTKPLVIRAPESNEFKQLILPVRIS